MFLGITCAAAENDLTGKKATQKRGEVKISQDVICRKGFSYLGESDLLKKIHIRIFHCLSVSLKRPYRCKLVLFQIQQLWLYFEFLLGDFQ